MKIGIIGTACSGKTTLSKQLAQYFNFELIEEAARRYKAEELTDNSNDEIQYDMMLYQIKEELFAGKNIITDRTIIDPYIHLENKGFKPKMHTLDLIRSWAETYDVFLLCKKLPFVEDNFRCDVNMEPAFISFMKNNLIEYEIIDGNESERFEKAKKIIEQRFNR